MTEHLSTTHLHKSKRKTCTTVRNQLFTWIINCTNPKKGISQWLRYVATIPYHLGKKLGQWLGWGQWVGGLPLSKSPGNRQVSKVVQEHFQFKEIIANKSRTWKISIKHISFTVVSNNLVKKLLKQHIPNFLVILPPHDVAINAHPHPRWLHRWAEHQFFNFSFQAVHLCLIAMSKHASSEDGRIPCSNGLFLDFHVGFWESTFFLKQTSNDSNMKFFVYGFHVSCESHHFAWGQTNPSPIYISIMVCKVACDTCGDVHGKQQQQVYHK